MRYIVTIVVLLLALCASATDQKLWVREQGVSGGGLYQVLYIEDLETGTRCYSVVATSGSGAASIACVAKGR